MQDAQHSYEDAEYIDPRLLDTTHVDAVPIPNAKTNHFSRDVLTHNHNHNPFAVFPELPPVDLDGWEGLPGLSERRHSEHLNIIGSFEFDGKLEDVDEDIDPSVPAAVDASFNAPHVSAQGLPLNSGYVYYEDPWTHLRAFSTYGSGSSIGQIVPDLSSPATDHLTLDPVSPTSPAALHGLGCEARPKNYGSFEYPNISDQWPQELCIEESTQQDDLARINTSRSDLLSRFTPAPHIGLISRQLLSTRMRDPLYDPQVSHLGPMCDEPESQGLWNESDILGDPQSFYEDDMLSKDCPLLQAESSLCASSNKDFQIPWPEVTPSEDFRNYIWTTATNKPRWPGLGDGFVTPRVDHGVSSFHFLSLPVPDSHQNLAGNHKQVSKMRETDFQVNMLQPQPQNYAAKRKYDVNTDLDETNLQTSLSHKPAQMPLVVIQWTGDGDASESNPFPVPAKSGVRIGRMTEEQRLSTKMKRNSRDVCIRCRRNRVQCIGDLPCQGCQKASMRMKIPQPCIKAHFQDIVESGTLNYISQRAINHLTLDGTHRVQMFLPPDFSLPELMNMVEQHRESFNVRAHHQLGSLYVLDFKKCYEFLSGLNTNSSSERLDLRDFIDNTLVTIKGWESCVQDNPRKEILSLLSLWNNMPSRFSYSLVSTDPSQPSRPLNIQSPADIPTILLAAQLSRIICRKLETDGYAELQRRINNLRTTSPASALKFVSELGQILLTLRWRVSWWELLGDGSAKEDPFRERYVERVRLLSRVLYFYYFAAKRRVGSWTEEAGKMALSGVISTYADAKPVFDEFPREESIEGFEEWLEKGKDLVRKAEVKRKLEGYQALWR